MGCSQFQPLHLLVLYCAFLLLGILFEVDLPFNRGLYDKKLEDIVLKVQQKGVMQLERDPGRKLMKSYLKRFLKSKEFGRVYQSVSKSVSLSRSEYDKNTDLRNLLKRKNKFKDNLTTENFDSYSSVHYNQEKRTFKFSSELNSFDEIIQLLTVPMTFCAELVSSFAVNSSPVPFYHCSARNLGRCFASNSGYGRYSYQFSQNCFKIKKTAGYDVSPAKLLPNMDRNIRVHSMGASDNRKGTDEIEAQKITVDNTYIFVKEFKDLTYMPDIRLDFKLNLAGLNSLHKYEVLSKLLKVIRWVLNKQGYHLERSSADSRHLHDYLHQEGLQQPLYIYTIWHLYSGGSSVQ